MKRLAEYKYGEFFRFALFCLVGLTGMAVDLLSYSTFLYYGVGLKLSRAMAIFIAMTWNFWLNRRVTFSYGRHLSVCKQYLRFVASCGIGMMISWSISVVLSENVDMFNGKILLAAIIGIFAGTLTNFTLSRYWVFKRLP